MTEGLQDLIATLIDAESERPLGAVTVRSNLASAPFSRSLHLGANNLLAKALRAIERDDAARAQALVDRAVALPYDEHEREYPGLWSARMLMFDAMVDALEESAEGDEAWLDAVFDVLADCGPDARRVIRRLLLEVNDDFTTDPRESRRIAEELRTGTETAEEFHAGLGEDRRAQAAVILEVLRAVAHYRRLLGAAE